MSECVMECSKPARYVEIWCEISLDFNGLRRQRSLEGSIDGHPRVFMKPGDATSFNLLSKRWQKWIGSLRSESSSDLQALAFLAAANERSIEMRLGMAWKGLLAIAALLALQKLDMQILLGQAVRDLASYGAIGKIILVVGWIGSGLVLIYMLLNHFWKINASELRTCIDLALLLKRGEDDSGEKARVEDANRPGFAGGLGL